MTTRPARSFRSMELSAVVQAKRLLSSASVTSHPPSVPPNSTLARRYARLPKRKSQPSFVNVEQHITKLEWYIQPHVGPV